MPEPIEESPTVVTPEGVRDGDPAALSGLTTRRGTAVLAYAEHVAAPGLAIDAAAEAFAWFRRAVVEAGDPYAVDPERTLLRGARYTSASHAPRVRPLRARLRGGTAPCELVPELLAARAERDLGEADLGRLSRHLSRCESCRLAEERFRVGERAYRDASDAPPDPFVARAIMAALLTAAPNAHTPAPSFTPPVAPVGPTGSPAPDAPGAAVDADTPFVTPAAAGSEAAPVDPAPAAFTGPAAGVDGGPLDAARADTPGPAEPAGAAAPDAAEPADAARPADPAAPVAATSVDAEPVDAASADEPAAPDDAAAAPADPIPAAGLGSVDEAAELLDDAPFEHEHPDGGEYRAARLSPARPTPPDGPLHPDDDGLGRTVPFTPLDVLEADVRAAPTAATLLADPILEPTAHLSDERQPTYEFDALPATAFDLESAPETRGRRSILAIIAWVLLAIVVLAAFAVVVFAATTAIVG